MSAETFARVMDGVCEVSPRPAVFFGGFGEPFAHPDLLAMLTAAKIAGCRVELITNGTMLDDEVRHALVRIGLDRLWVSIDGATPLADPTRASILRMLAANACCVCEMAVALGVGESNVSNHLARLRHAGLVRASRNEANLRLLRAGRGWDRGRPGCSGRRPPLAANQTRTWWASSWWRSSRCLRSSREWSLVAFHDC